MAVEEKGRTEERWEERRGSDRGGGSASDERSV